MYDQYTITDHDFACWAFGTTWINYLTFDADTMDLYKAWNELHGEELLLHPEGEVHQDMKKMKNLWEKHAEPSKTKKGVKLNRKKNKTLPISNRSKADNMGVNANTNKIKKVGGKGNGQKNAQSHPKHEVCRKGSDKRKEKVGCKDVKKGRKEKRKAR